MFSFPFARPLWSSGPSSSGPWRHSASWLSLGEIKYATAFTLRVLRFGHVLRNVKQTSQPSTLWANNTNYTSQKQEKHQKIGYKHKHILSNFVRERFNKSSRCVAQDNLEHFYLAKEQRLVCGHS